MLLSIFLRLSVSNVPLICEVENDISISFAYTVKDSKRLNIINCVFILQNLYSMKTEDKNAILLGQINNETNFSWLHNLSESNTLFAMSKSNSQQLHTTNTSNINHTLNQNHLTNNKCENNNINININNSNTHMNRDVHLNNLYHSDFNYQITNLHP